MKNEGHSSMPRPRRALLSLASAALISSFVTSLRAESITMAVDITAELCLVDIVAIPGTTTDDVDAAGLAAINAFLASNGSRYQLLALGRSINFPGNRSFGLTDPGKVELVDSFGVTVTVSGKKVPEPASSVMFVMGLPLSVFLVGWIRRRAARSKPGSHDNRGAHSSWTCGEPRN
jgi:hypothetical protein